MVTHKDALEEAIVEYEQWATHRHAIEASIKKYVSVRGLAIVPTAPDVEMLGAWYRYKNGHRFAGEEPARDTSDFGAYRAMLAAAPDPFGDAP